MDWADVSLSTREGAMVDCFLLGFVLSFYSIASGTHAFISLHDSRTYSSEYQWLRNRGVLNGYRIISSAVYLSCTSI